MNLPNQNSAPSFSSEMGIPTARITKKAQPVKERKPCVWVGLCVLAVLLVFAGGFRSINKRQHEEQPASKWTESAGCSAHCSKDGYSKPPLVIISFDGFSREYLDEPGWVKWLKKVGGCGVKAEKVFPVFPSNTFVNQYSILTGLYAENHGIVNNRFWDKELSPEGIEYMGATKNDKYFLGEPIWSIYQRLTGGKANCYMWPGSAFNNHGHPCNSVPFNYSTPFQERWDTVRNWLLLPESERPGLIIVYFHEPDVTGHQANFHKNRSEFGNDERLKEKVMEMDGSVDRFLQQMADDGLINCVNFAFVSDHGMKPIEKTLKVDDFIKPIPHFGAGAISLVYAEQSVIDAFVTEARKKCKENNKDFLLSTNEIRLLRLHYSNSNRIAPLVMAGRPGVIFSNSDKGYIADHGFDYLEKEVQTTFFAMGPSFKQGTVLPPFQNVEYLNLWLDLLGIDPTTVSSNGTVGVLDAALKNAPRRGEESVDPIEKCSTPAQLKGCCSTPSDKCVKLPLHELFSSKTVCYDTAENICGKSVLSHNGETRGVIEVIERKMPVKCTGATEEGPCRSRESLSMAADPSEDIISLRISFPGEFYKEVFSALDDFLSALLKQHGRVAVLSGTAVDRDRNGLADSDQSQPPSLFFRLFLFCRDSRWSPDGLSCVSPDQLDSRSFTFPIIKSDPNCLKGVELLRYYSCRLRDIELVVGIEVVAREMNKTQKARLRAKIDEDFF